MWVNSGWKLPSYARVVAGYLENPRPSIALRREVRLASCCHSTERRKGESRDKTPFVVGHCAKPQQDAPSMQQQGFRARQLHNTSCRTKRGRRYTNDVPDVFGRGGVDRDRKSTR